MFISGLLVAPARSLHDTFDRWRRGRDAQCHYLLSASTTPQMMMMIRQLHGRSRRSYASSRWGNLWPTGISSSSVGDRRSSRAHRARSRIRRRTWAPEIQRSGRQMRHDITAAEEEAPGSPSGTSGPVLCTARRDGATCERAVGGDGGTSHEALVRTEFIVR